MQDLELVGVHDDGERLVLSGADGSRYLLEIDEPLRAAVRRDRARLGQLQIAIDGSLRPKDIQSRIRAGQSAQELADASGLPLEHILRYEGPVLAEREHVAQRGRGTVVQRQGGTSVALEDLVSQRMKARSVGADRSWDAWREDTGTWVVQVSFRAGSKVRVAQWRFDVPAAHLEPMDDEARWLTARAGEETGPIGSGRRLNSVKVSERVYDVEADGGVKEGSAASGTGRPAQVAPTDEDRSQDPRKGDDEPARTPKDRTVDLLDALRGRRGKRQPLEDGSEDDDLGQGDLVDALIQESDQAPPAHPPASRPQDATDAEVLALPEPVAEPVPDSAPEEAADAPEAAQHGPSATPAEDEPTEQPRQRKSRTTAKPRRASVPSWDDIVFGAKKD